MSELQWVDAATAAPVEDAGRAEEVDVDEDVPDPLVALLPLGGFK